MIQESAFFGTWMKNDQGPRSKFGDKKILPG